MDLEILFWPKDADVKRTLREGKVPDIIRLLGHPDPGVQQKATDTLVAMGNPIVPSLIYELVHWRLSVRIGAIEALGAIGARDAVEPLIERLRKDTHPEVRFAAAMSLGSIGDPAAINPLVTALRDPDKYVRNGAAHALDILEWQAEEPSLLAYYYIALQEWDSLVALGEAAGAPLMWALKDQDPKVRAAVVETVGRIHSQVVMYACSLALKDRDPEVRKKAAQVFPKCGIPLTLLPMGLSKRPKTKPSPFIAALLNLMFLGIGYNYLGYWFGLLVFQCFITINLMMVAVTGSSLPLLLIPLFSVPYSIPFSYHAWYLARKIPDI